MKSLAIRQVKTDPPQRENVRGLTLTDLENILSSIGEKSFRAKQIASWVYKRRAASFHDMTDLSQDLRDRLEKYLTLEGTPSVKTEQSHDGTIKLLLDLADGEKVESVLIPDGKRLTLCISTQAGCAMGCAFCCTGLTGFRRNLLAHEMIDQVFAAHSTLSQNTTITSYVLMGMGEPLVNYGEVKKFLTLATSTDCLGISPRRITLSTVGISQKVEIFGRDFRDVNLAVSLNATTDETRRSLMPSSKGFSIKRLINACSRYPLPKRRRITIEYVLLKGINDSIDDAKRLIKLLKGIPCKINLIPFNPFPGAKFQRSSEKVVHDFKSQLVKGNYTVMIRASKGNDISAACGQLRGC